MVLIIRYRMKKMMAALVGIFCICFLASLNASEKLENYITVASSQKLEVLASTSISIFQRSKVALKNKTSRDFYLSIGDITGGQVMVTVFVYSDANKRQTEILIPNQSFTPNTSKTFEYEGRLYRLKLQKLRNHLLGDDHAIFNFYHLKKEKKQKPELV